VWEKTITTNLMSAVYGVQHFLPDMLAADWPCAIVNTGSKHGHHHLTIGCIARGHGAPRACLDQRLGLLQRSIPDRDVMAGLEEVGGHRSAHLAESDEAHLHATSPAMCAWKASA
jgi:NAD(P)-dependent dehydrogenase (short-subunit alcohol dehydrogenase family)